MVSNLILCLLLNYIIGCYTYNYVIILSTHLPAIGVFDDLGCSGPSGSASASSSTAVVSQFNKYANEIGVDLHQTQMKIQELGKRSYCASLRCEEKDDVFLVVARAKGIFNDQSARINDYTGDIKRVSDGGVVWMFKY